MPEDIKTQQPEASPTPGASGGESGKTFTQDEVNRIVSDRLARERAKAEPDDREQALRAREARLDCRDYLTEKKYPSELLEVLDSSDVDKFKGNVEKLVKAFPSIVPELAGVIPHVIAATGGAGGAKADAIANAFKPKI